MNGILKYGLIGGLALIVANLIFTIWQDSNLTANFLVSILVISFIILNANRAIDMVKVNDNGFISFNNAFKIAFGVFLISITLSNLFTMIQDQIYFPDKYEEAKIAAMEQAEEMFGDENESLYTSLYEKLFKPSFLFILKMIGGSLFYLIVALVMASIKKHEDAHKILQ